MVFGVFGFNVWISGHTSRAQDLILVAPQGVPRIKRRWAACLASSLFTACTIIAWPGKRYFLFFRFEIFSKISLEGSNASYSSETSDTDNSDYFIYLQSPLSGHSSTLTECLTPNLGKDEEEIFRVHIKLLSSFLHLFLLFRYGGGGGGGMSLWNLELFSSLT